MTARLAIHSHHERTLHGSTQARRVRWFVLLAIALFPGSRMAAEDALEFPIRRPWGIIEADEAGLKLRVKQVPDSGKLTIPRLNNPIGRILLARQTLTLKPNVQDWEISLPKNSPQPPFTVQVATIGRPKLPNDDNVVTPAADGSVFLAANDAVTHGRLLRYEPQPHKNTVGYWADEKDWCEWRFRIEHEGQYEVWILQGCGKGQGGSEVAVQIGSEALEFRVEDTGHFQNFKWRLLGALNIAENPSHTLQIRPKKKAKAAVMDVRAVRLRPTVAVPEKERRPNIVFCFADDWGRYASAYQSVTGENSPNQLLNTPAFDRIASEGVLFTNAFVNAPSCTPCRSSLLSGQYFFRTGRGAILQGAIWDASIPSYPLLLRDAGYHIGHTYKVWSPGAPADAPYGAAQYAYTRAGRKFNQFSQAVSGAKNAEHEKQLLLAEVRGNFRMFLDDRKAAAPFCYWFGPTNCHRKWTRGSGKNIWGLNPDDLKGKLPSFLPDEEIVREDFCDYLGEVQAFDAGVGVILDELERIGELENTLVVVSGDHGAPGFPGGKCNLYDFGVGVSLAVRWGKHAPPNRVVNDFVCLPDLAPTFLEAAGVDRPDAMTAASLMPILSSEKQGWVDAKRDAVIVGRERHVARARTENLPYPQRALRTKDFLYIRNFKPERWPMGVGPGHGLPDGPFPDFATVESNTFALFGDLDASPTKAWIVDNRNKPGVDRFFQYAFGRRPAEELYDLRQDPDQVRNVAEDAAYKATQEMLAARLMQALRDAGDPRVIEGGTTFDRPPFTDAPPPRRRR